MKETYTAPKVEMIEFDTDIVVGNSSLLPGGIVGGKSDTDIDDCN